MTAKDDFRTLARKDKHTRRLRDVSDEWIDNSGLTVHSVPGVAIMTRKLVCPVDALSTGNIAYWAVDHSRKLEAALAQTSLQALAEAERIGSPSIWGWVAENAPHLFEFLDRVVSVGACRRVQGEGTYRDGAFYIAPIREARRYMMRIA